MVNYCIKESLLNFSLTLQSFPFPLYSLDHFLMDDIQLIEILKYNIFLYLGTLLYGILISKQLISSPTLLITYKYIEISVYAFSLSSLISMICFLFEFINFHEEHPFTAIYVEVERGLLRNNDLTFPLIKNEYIYTKAITQNRKQSTQNTKIRNNPRIRGLQQK